MTIKGLKDTVKVEKLKESTELFIRVSIQNDDGTWRTEVVPIETYHTKADGSLQLGCAVWNPNCEDD